MLTLKYFKSEDVLKINPVEEGIENIMVGAEYNAAAGPAYTGYIDGRIVACGGIRVEKNGSGTPWFIMNKGEKCKKSTFQTVKLMMKILIEECEFKYLRTFSKIGFPQSQRFLEHLGFKKIRTLKSHYYYRLEA